MVVGATGPPGLRVGVVALPFDPGERTRQVADPLHSLLGVERPGEELLLPLGSTFTCIY